MGAPVPHHRSSSPLDRRILVIGADGLRPDLIDPILMPHVAALAAGGARSADHHAVWPTHTRVNMSALATGTVPGRHGIVANTMLVPGATEDDIIDTANFRHLDALDRFSGGHVLLADDLGSILAAHGARLAVAGTGSGGSNLLWTPHHRSRIVNTNTAFAIADLYDLREKLGEIPDPATPDTARISYAVRAVIDLYLPDPDNRVIVLWFAEPDSSLHKHGLGSPESRAAMQAVDAAAGRILDALDRMDIRDQMDVLFLSDHGHSTIRAHRTLRDALIEAERDLGRGSLPPLATASDYVYPEPGTPPPSAARLRPLVEWLTAQPWSDLVLAPEALARQLPGVLPLEPLWNGHINDRAPLLAVSPQWTHDRNIHDVPGTVAALTTQSALKSSHGSASPYDLHATLIANGPSFREGITGPLPTGATDLLPTILTILGLPVPPGRDGRVLAELLRDPARAPQDEAVDETLGPVHAPVNGSHAGAVHLHRVGTTTYVHGADGGSGTAPFIAAPPATPRTGDARS